MSIALSYLRFCVANHGWLVGVLLRTKIISLLRRRRQKPGTGVAPSLFEEPQGIFKVHRVIDRYTPPDICTAPVGHHWLEYSLAVTHPSTNPVQRCLTSVIGWELGATCWAEALHQPWNSMLLFKIVLTIFLCLYY